jgi:hypothetical protein
MIMAAETKEVDPFDDARAGFVKMDDVTGRLLLISCTDSGERQSTQKGAKEGEMYTYIVADVAVLDGEVTETVEEVPTLLEDFQLSGATLVGQLQPKLKKFLKGTGNGVVLGRLTQKPSSFKTPMWVLDAPTDKDKVVARKYIAEHPKVEVDPFNQ